VDERRPGPALQKTWSGIGAALHTRRAQLLLPCKVPLRKGTLAETDSDGRNEFAVLLRLLTNALEGGRALQVGPLRGQAACVQ